LTAADEVRISEKAGKVEGIDGRSLAREGARFRKEKLFFTK